MPGEGSTCLCSSRKVSLLLQESLKKVAWFEERISFSMFHPGKPFSLQQVGGKDMVDRWVDEKQGSGQ